MGRWYLGQTCEGGLELGELATIRGVSDSIVKMTYLDQSVRQLWEGLGCAVGVGLGSFVGLSRKSGAGQLSAKAQPESCCEVRMPGGAF